MENNLISITHAIQLAVAPVFLLTGIAGLLNVLGTRLARIVDRRRVLLTRADDRDLQHAREDLGSSTQAPQDSDPIAAIRAGRMMAREEGDNRELAALDQRARMMYFAVFFAVLAALMVCLVVATGFIGALFQIDIGRWLAGLFIASMGSMIVALGLFLREVYVAVVPGRMHRRL